MGLEGKHIGEFEIIERLGQGGMAAVYKARQTSLDRIVALKTLQASLADNADYIARFRQEARAAAGLNHPNLVQVISAGESDGLHWFAMEYVEGESAWTRLRREGRLKPLEAMAIAIGVATALDYGWRKAGLIHRDIKPDNIFLSGDGEVKLGDLGLAKNAGQTEGLTATGRPMGTPHYMSPEQWEGMRDVDPRADIYSLGCTLYHLLCGQPPYTGNSSAAVMMKHMSAPIPDLRKAWPECPPELAAAVRKMMRKRPADRQQSYEEVNADLRRACGALSRMRAPSFMPATQIPAPRKTKRGVPVMAWLGCGAALSAAMAALIHFAPWKEGSAMGTPKPALSQTTGGKAGKQKMDAEASLAAAMTPVSQRTVVFTTTPPPAATPTPSTPIPSTPKPATEVEKWFAQVDGPRQEAFQKQVLKPFETGVTDLRARYLTSLDAGIAKASAAGRLAEALVWRTERQAFEKARNVASDDDATPIGVKTLRAAFRQQLAKLDQDRIAQAKALHAQYDAILAKNQTLLTKNQHLDDALLLQTKRDEIARAWLGPSPLIGGGDAGQPDSARSGSKEYDARKAAGSDASKPVTSIRSQKKPATSGGWIDALALVDPVAHDSPDSVWERTPNGIQRHNEQNSRYDSAFMLPVELPSSYGIEFQFTCGAANESVGLSIPLGDNRYAACWFFAKNAGIAKIDGKNPQQGGKRGASSPLVLKLNHRYIAQVEVHRAPGNVDIQFFVDGVAVGNYRGAVDGLTLTSHWQTTADGIHAFLGANDGVVFHRVSIKPLEDLKAGEKAPSPTRAPPASSFTPSP